MSHPPPEKSESPGALPSTRTKSQSVSEPHQNNGKLQKLQAIYGPVPSRIRAWRSRDLYLPQSKQAARKAELAEDARLDREIEERSRKDIEYFAEELLERAKFRREG
jgi:hypothetical protein